MKKHRILYLLALMALAISFISCGTEEEEEEETNIGTIEYRGNIYNLNNAFYRIDSTSYSDITVYYMYFTTTDVTYEEEMLIGAGNGILLAVYSGSSSTYYRETPYEVLNDASEGDIVPANVFINYNFVDLSGTSISIDSGTLGITKLSQTNYQFVGSFLDAAGYEIDFYFKGDPEFKDYL